MIRQRTEMGKEDIGVGASVHYHGSYFCSKPGRADSAKPTKCVISRRVAHPDRSSRASGPEKIPADTGSFLVSGANGLPSRAP